MKLLLILSIFAVLVAGYMFLYPSAMAAPTAKMTLSAGESVKVRRDGCSLQVTKNKPAVVRVECQTTTGPIGGTFTRNPSTDDVILNAGQKLRVRADGCELTVTKNKPRKVKVKCNAIDEPDATVIVGPDGSLSYSGVANIKVGQTVEWVWESDDHTVTSGDGSPDGLFCSPDDTNCATAPISDTGATYSHTFETVGSFPYYCRVHDGMSSTVNVSPVYEP